MHTGDLEVNKYNIYFQTLNNPKASLSANVYNSIHSHGMHLKTRNWISKEKTTAELLANKEGHKTEMEVIGCTKMAKFCKKWLCCILLWRDKSLFITWLSLCCIRTLTRSRLVPVILMEWLPTVTVYLYSPRDASFVEKLCRSADLRTPATHDIQLQFTDVQHRET